MNSAEVLIKFKADTGDVESKTNKLGGAMKGLTGKIALGNLAAKGIAKGFSMITGSMDAAISRVDTMNNFSKVMSNLGISTDDADASVKKLSEKLSGLPTSLDSAAASVQRFTSKNGDIQKSTDLFLAMNNAILAGGAPADQQASAIEQLSQAYAKGKPDMQEWRAIQSVMPAQLKQIATEMGYAGGNADQLGEDLRSGKVSMEEFMEVVSKMNKEGGENFKSFEEQARNATGGIQTAISNMKTAITRGVGNAIGELDKSLQNAGFDSISTYISKFGGVFEKGITGVAQFIGPILTKVLSGEMSFEEAGNQIGAKAGELLSKLATELTKRLPTIIQSLLQLLMGAINGLLPFLPQIITTLVQGVLDTLMMLLNNVSALIDLGMNILLTLMDGIMQALPVLIEALPDIILKLIDAILENLPKFIEVGIQLLLKLIEGLLEAAPQVTAACWKIIIGILEKFGILSPKMADKAREAVEKVKNWFMKLPDKVKAIPGKIINFFKSLPSKMGSIGLDVVKGIGNGITNGIGWIKDKITSFVGNVKSFIKKLFGIKSPSKWANVMIGQNLVLGISEGLEAQKNSIARQMTDIVKGMEQQLAMNTSLSPNVSSSTSTHFSPNINVHIENNMTTDPLGQVVNKVKTFSGGAKNDYNYGR